MRIEEGKIEIDNIRHKCENDLIELRNEYKIIISKYENKIKELEDEHKNNKLMNDSEHNICLSEIQSK